MRSLFIASSIVLLAGVFATTSNGQEEQHQQPIHHHRNHFIMNTNGDDEYPVGDEGEADLGMEADHSDMKHYRPEQGGWLHRGGGVQNKAAFHDWITGTLDHDSNKWMLRAAEYHSAWVDEMGHEEQQRSRRLGEIEVELASLRTDIASIEEQRKETRRLADEAGHEYTSRDDHIFVSYIMANEERVTPLEAEKQQLDEEKIAYQYRTETRRDGGRIAYVSEKSERKQERQMEVQAGQVLNAAFGSLRNNSMCDYLSQYGAWTARVYDVCGASFTYHAQRLFDSKTIWYNETAAELYWDQACSHPCISALVQWLQMPQTSQCWSNGLGVFGGSKYYETMVALCKKNPSTSQRCGVELGVSRRRDDNHFQTTDRTKTECYSIEARFNETHCVNHTLDRVNNSCWWNPNWNGGRCELNITQKLVEYDCNDYCYQIYNNYTRTDSSAKCQQFSGVYCAVEEFRRSRSAELYIESDGAVLNKDGTLSSTTCSQGYRMCYRWNTGFEHDTSYFGMRTMRTAYTRCMDLAAFYWNSSFAQSFTEASCQVSFYNSWQQVRALGARRDQRCALRSDGQACYSMFLGKTAAIVDNGLYYVNGSEMTLAEISSLRTLASSDVSGSAPERTNCTAPFWNLTGTSGGGIPSWVANSRQPNPTLPNPFEITPLFKCCFEWDDYLRQEQFISNWIYPLWSGYSERIFDQRFNSNRTEWIPRVAEVNESAVPTPSSTYRFVDSAQCLSNITISSFVAEGTTPCSGLAGTTSTNFYSLNLDLNWTVIRNNNTVYRDTMAWFTMAIARVLRLDPAENIKEVSLGVGTIDLNNTRHFKDPVLFKFKVYSRDPAIVNEFVPEMWRLFKWGYRSSSALNALFDSPTTTTAFSRFDGRTPLCRYHSDNCGARQKSSQFYFQKLIPNYEMDFEADGIPKDECFTEEYYNMYREVYYSCTISNETRAVDEDTSDLYYRAADAAPEWEKICSGTCRANLMTLENSPYFKRCFASFWPNANNLMHVLCTKGDKNNYCGIQFSMTHAYATCPDKPSEASCVNSGACTWNPTANRCDVYAEHGDQFWEDACERTCYRRLVSSLTGDEDSETRRAILRMRGYCARDSQGALCMPQIQEEYLGWFQGASGNWVNRSVARLCTDRNKKRCLHRIWNAESDYYAQTFKRVTARDCDRGFCSTSSWRSFYVPQINHYKNLATHFCDTMNPFNDTAWLEDGRHRGVVYCAQAYAHWHKRDSCFARASRTFGDNTAPVCDTECSNELRAMKHALGCCAATSQLYCGTSDVDLYGKGRIQERRRKLWYDRDPYDYDPTAAPPTPAPDNSTTLPPPTPRPITRVPETPTPIPTTAPPPTYITPAPTTTRDRSVLNFTKCFMDVSVCNTNPFFPSSAFQYNFIDRCQAARDNKTDYKRVLSLRTGVKFSLLGNLTEGLFDNGTFMYETSRSTWYESMGENVRQDIATNLGIDIEDIISWFWSEDISQAWVAGEQRPVVPVFDGSRRQQQELGDSGSTFNFEVQMEDEDETDLVASDFETMKANNDMPLPMTVNAVESECEENECTLGTDGTGVQSEGNEVANVNGPAVEGASSTLGSGWLIASVVLIASSLLLL